MKIFSFILLAVLLVGCKSQINSYYTYQDFENDSKIITQESDTLKPYMTEAFEKNDSLEIRRLLNLDHKIQKKHTLLREKFIRNNPKDTLSLLLINGLFYEQSYPLSSVKKHYKSLSKKLRNSEKGEEIKKQFNFIESLSIGKKAPDFSAPNPEGQMVSLKESLGKVTIIDFWASWCAPCKQEHKNTVKLYDEYHEKGLNIIGVSIDREYHKDKWIEAIKNENLSWIQVSNLQDWNDPIARQYNITSIPQIFILDSKGKIIGKDLRGDALRDKLKELLGE